VDVNYRDGFGRSGTWLIVDRVIKFPTIARISNSRIPKLSSEDIVKIDSSKPLGGLSKELDSRLKGIKGPETQGNRNKAQRLEIDIDNEAKLNIYHQQNPFFNATVIERKNIDLHKPYLIVPGIINYPDSLTERGISVTSVYPPTKKDPQQDFNGVRVQLITTDSEAIRNDTNILFVVNSLKLLDNPRALVSRILSISHRNEPSKLLYLPGIATVNNLAILVYLGVDVVDNAQCILKARAGKLMTQMGFVSFSDLDNGQLICSCDGCKELQNKKDNKELFKSILKHNENALSMELALIKHAISKGKLRNLVEQRMLSEATLASIIRILDLEYYDVLEQYFPLYTPKQYPACSREALNRIEIKRFQQRVIDRYSKPESARILLFLPCSARKPYSTSKSHKLFRKTILESLPKLNYISLLHEVIITSPLGLVPRELELVYPAQQYDIPVTGHWFKDELDMIRTCIEGYLNKNEYEHILIHFNGEMAEFIKSSVKSVLSNKSPNIKDKTKVVITSSEHPTSSKSLNTLKETLNEVLKDYPKSSTIWKQQQHLETLQCISQYQFGILGKELVLGCMVKGKYPNLKLFRDGTQIGMLTGERGLISLTLEGGRKLAEFTGSDYKIMIDDFVPKGSIMAVGVEKADEKIRIGDDVVACFNDEVRAVGQAVMPGIEMERSNRGVAVKVRHHK